MKWILAICKGLKIGAYLGDISGACDRVFKDYMMAKLQAAGVGPAFLNFLDSYLDPRVGQVAVEGELSDEFTIANSVFQGTVLGPTLWNLFFSDVATPATMAGGDEAMFADDLNVFQQFDKDEPPDNINNKLEECRTHVHKWGRTNRAVFDPGKKHTRITHPQFAEGDPFKLLGLMVDCKLVMDQAIEKVLAQIRPKVKALLRTRAHYSSAQLVDQFKTQVWGIMEAQSGGFFHASTSHLAKLDDVQRHFLNDIEVSEATAFIDMNFAPPTLRRNIGMLGLLHKRALGLCHPDYEVLLPWFRTHYGFVVAGRHDKQLYNHALEVTAQVGLFRCSVFAMVDVYNHLSQSVVDSPSVSAFQSHLTPTVSG